MITRAKISGLRANSFVVVEQFTTFSQFKSCFIVFFLVIQNCIRGAALIQGRRLLVLLPQMRRLFKGLHLIEGGVYSSKYGIFFHLVH